MKRPQNILMVEACDVERQKTVAGFCTMSGDYAACAELLYRESQANRLKLRTTNPVDFLCAHALELALKGTVEHFGQRIGSPESYGHRLLELYDALREAPISNDLVRTIEKEVKRSWTTLLRSARDEQAKKFIAMGVTDSADLAEFGVLDNASIGEGLPKLRKQVQWLDERHRRNGSLFRYHQTRIDTRFEITAFGLREDVVVRSSVWAAQEIIRQIGPKLPR